MGLGLLGLASLLSAVQLLGQLALADPRAHQPAFIHRVLPGWVCPLAPPLFFIGEAVCVGK